MSVTSETGITVELLQLEYGTNCLRIELLVSGFRLPPGTALDDTASFPIWDFALFEATSDIPLALEPLGGGGGVGQAPDGSVSMGRGAVYAYSSAAEGNDPVRLLVRVTVDQSLGFQAPLVFQAQAIPSTENCGLQASLSR